MLFLCLNSFECVNRTNRKVVLMIKLLSIVLIGFLFLGGCNQEDTGQTDDATPVEENEENQNIEEPNQSEENGKDTTEEEEGNQSEENSDSIDKGRAETVLTEYEQAFQKVVSYTNESGKQQEYTTKQGLIEHFKHFMSEEIAQSLVNTYFEERDGGLYVVPMDAPIFLQEDQPYTFTKNDDGTVTITQERNNELYGHLNVEYTLAKRDGFWIVQNIESHGLETKEEASREKPQN